MSPRFILRVLALVILVQFIVITTRAQEALWGVATYGNSKNLGVIFKTNTDGTGYEVQHNFVPDENGAFPYSYLTKTPNGKLYGVTANGGVNGVGVLFEYDLATQTYTKKFDFSEQDGKYPDREMILAANGKLYGSTSQGGNSSPGVIFEYDYINNIYTKKIDGISSAAFVLTSGGQLLGLSGAMIFVYDPQLNSVVPKVTFSSGVDGSIPDGNLLEASDGMFYGTMQYGGTNGDGLIFRYDPVTEQRTTLLSFNPIGSFPTGTLVEVAGKLYGITTNGGLNNGGVLFEYDIVNNQLNKKADMFLTGSVAIFGSTLFKTQSGKLYGHSKSMIFEYDFQNNSINNKKTLTDNVDGLLPRGSFIETETGILYGACSVGGTKGAGTIFKFEIATNDYSVKHSFIHAPDGEQPRSTVTAGPNGKFYGVTATGGSTGSGVLYEFDPVTKNYEVKVNFDFYGEEGGNPVRALTAAPNGKLYGLSYLYGGYGKLFEYDPGTSSFEVKHEFQAIEGNPSGDLLLAANGKLYGNATSGGLYGYGIIYQFDPATNSFEKVFDFESQFGPPKGGFVEISSGRLIGVSQEGGTNGYGRLYEYNYLTDQATPKPDFFTTTLRFPQEAPTKANNGKLYGLAMYGGANGWGGIYEFDGQSQLILVYSLAYYEGFFATSTFTLGSNGKLYGLLSSGGAYGLGTLIEFDPNTYNITLKHDFNLPTGISPIGSLTPFKMAQDQTIMFDALPEKFFGDDDFELVATTSSTLPVTFTSSDPDVATVNGNIITILKAGTTTITASQTGNSDYHPATSVEQVLTISKASQEISFEALAEKSYGDENSQLAAISSSGLSVTFTSSDTEVATIAGNIVTIHNAGTTTITASQNGNSNYNAANPREQVLTVNKIDQEISFDLITDKNYGDENFQLSAISSSGLPVTFTSSNPNVVAIVDHTVTILKGGASDIIASQNGNRNYYPATSVLQAIMIKKIAQVISFEIIGEKKYGDANFQLIATSSASLPVAFWSSDQNVAIVASDNSVAIRAAGQITITAYQPGNENYLESEVKQVLTIKKADQQITFTPIASMMIGNGSTHLIATSSSGLGVSFSTTSDRVSISGSGITPLKPGSVSVKAFQEGDSNHNPAAAVFETFCVNPDKPMISISGALSNILTSSSAEGNQWYRNTIAIPQAIEKSFTATESGEYTLQVKIDNCASEMSDKSAMVITGAEGSLNSMISVYPNPTKRFLVLDLTKFASHEVGISTFDRLGRQKSMKTVQGGNLHTLDLNDYASDQYILKLSVDHQVITFKFIKH